MDWVRLSQTSRDLSGTGGKLRDVTPQELARHKSKDDCWTALSGRVYNVTPYLKFHPGGEDELMRAAGRDGTRLFNEVHKWVNFESMLQKCLVGRLVASSSGAQAPTYGNLLTASRALPDDHGQQPGPPSVVAENQKPRFDFYETDTCIKLSIYARVKTTETHHILIGSSQDETGAIKILVRFPQLQKSYQLHFTPLRAIHDNIEVKHMKSIGKLDISLTKKEAGYQWKTLGKALSHHDCLLDELPELTWKCRILATENVTHDTKLFTLQLPPASYLIVPTGSHVHIHVSVSGMDVQRSYTPVFRLDNYSDTWWSTELLFLIKVYDHGAVTPVLWQLKPGDELCISGYSGNFAEMALDNLQGCKSVLLLAAGTGITPMIKVMLAALSQKKSVHLMFFNKTEQDIIWHKELEELTCKSDGRFKVSHVLSRPSAAWTGSTGLIRDELLSAALQLHRPDEAFVCACGPPGFTGAAQRIISELRIPPHLCHIFTG